MNVSTTNNNNAVLNKVDGRSKEHVLNNKSLTLPSSNTQQNIGTYPQEFPNGLFDGFDEIVSTNSTANATVGSNMPTVTLREARQPLTSSSSLVNNAVKSWDNFITRRSQTSSSSSSLSLDNYSGPTAERHGQRPRQRSFYRLLPSGSNRSCVPNASYSPTLGLTIGSIINVDEPRVVRQEQEGPILIEDDDNITDSSSADIPTSEWDSYIDYVTCSESDDGAEGSNNEEGLNENTHKGGWRQCLAWVAKAGGHRSKRRRRKQVRRLRKPDTHTRRIRKILRALSLATEFDTNIYSDSRLAKFFVMVLLHTEYHNFSNCGDIINLPTFLRPSSSSKRPSIPNKSNPADGGGDGSIASSHGSIDDTSSPSSSSSCEDNANEDWQTLGFSERGFQSLGRDLNRPGSCMFGLLLMIFFAVEDNEAADIVLKVIRNTSVCPPELFGLFAVNGAKWVRDICRQVNTNQRVSELFHGVGEDWYRSRNLDFDYIATWWLQSSATKVTPGFPKDIEKKFIRVRRGRDVYGYEVLSDDNDGMLSLGKGEDGDNTDGEHLLLTDTGRKDISKVWSRTAGTGESGNTIIGNDITDSDRSIRMRNRMAACDIPPPEKLLSMRKSISSSSSSSNNNSNNNSQRRQRRRSSNIPLDKQQQQQHTSIIIRATSSSATATDSIPEEGPSASSPILSQPCTMVTADRVPSCHNIILWTDVLVASGTLYAYTMISFAKFWLEQDMIQASGEDANKKLNNEFINQHFVSKLTVPRGGISGITSRTRKVFGRVKDLYQKLEDQQIRKLSLASRLSERSSAVGGGDDDYGGRADMVDHRTGNNKVTSATEPHLKTIANNGKPIRKSAPGKLHGRSSIARNTAVPSLADHHYSGQHDHIPTTTPTGGTGSLGNSRSL